MDSSADTPTNKNKLTDDTRSKLMSIAFADTQLRSWQWKESDDHLTWLGNDMEVRTAIITKENLFFYEPLFGKVLEGDKLQVREHGDKVAKGIDTEFEYRTNEAGSAKTLCVTARCNSEGTIYGTIRDITRNNVQHKNLRQINDAFQQSEEMANLGNWKVHLKNGEYDFSGNLFKIFGVDDNSFVPGPDGFRQFVHPEDLTRLMTVDNLKEHPGTPVYSEFRIIRPGGDTRFVKSVSRIYNDGDDDLVILGTIQDVTGDVLVRKIMEEKATMSEMIIENNVDYVAAYDKDLKVTAWNRKCVEKTGLEKSDVIGKHVTEVFPGQEGMLLLQDLKQALKGELVHRAENAPSADGFFDFFILPLTNKSEIFGVLCISHDLSEIKHVTDKLVELNYSLKQKNDELEQSNNELASFSYVASHDLQEPLRKIQTFSNRIMEKELQNLSTQGVEYFKRMESAAKRMQILIDDLLTFSRTNTQQKDFSEVDLNDLLADVKSEIREVIEEKNAIIESEPLPVANVISFQFHQLLQNLLLNAIKYNKPGQQPIIKITCSKINSQAGQLANAAPMGEFYKIDITDNGIGFEQQYHLKIFELFQRLHGKSEYPGTGLGLAICRRIMQNHEGFITAKGEPGVGATFTLYLPA